MNKFFKIILFLILAIFLVALILFIIGSRDIVPPDDSDLILPSVDIPENENAYFDIMEANEIISGLKKEMEEGWDMGLTCESTAKLVKIFDHIDRATALNIYQIPELENPENLWLFSQINFPSVLSLRDLISSKSIKRSFLSDLEAEEMSIKQAFQLVKLGHLLENSPRPFIINYLPGIALKREGLELLRELFGRANNLSPEIYRYYINELDSYISDRESLRNALKMEAHSFLNTIDKYTEGEIILEELGLGKESFYSKFLFQPNKTKKELIEKSQKLLLQTETCKDYDNFSPPSFWNYIIGNFHGEYYAWTLASSYNNIHLNVCIEDFSIRATKLFLALKVYKNDYGHLPQNLSELVPNYISTIPEDPFDNKPLKYSIEKNIIYSVGRDLIDSGGSTGKYLREMPDPTIEINF
jgi:hypothetical protein